MTTQIFDGIHKHVNPPYCDKPDDSHVLIYEHGPSHLRRREGEWVQAQWAPVGEDAALLVKTYGLVLECEILSTGEVALYCHLPDEDDYGCDIAQNGPGEREPAKVLKQMITKKVEDIKRGE